jgi:hypothetical protein
MKLLNTDGLSFHRNDFFTFYVPSLILLLTAAHSATANRCDATAADFYSAAGYILHFIFAGIITYWYELSNKTKQQNTV